ncbi:NAD(P)H-dependent oxidoreductase [Acinetobacter calcoaceticus]|uniref:NAD(P)H-dependent oxidoreductase n=1 Tax=Acinetobacter calcoaceticus TaxID=471 RepID=UPI0002F6E76B|nr:NAD(P)H-dependent oxidoreductase [Acinetobacter calcoaceticus]
MSQLSKRIVVINGHPSDISFNHALAHNYVAQVKTLGVHVDLIEIAKLDFEPNLKYGYEKRMDLEPDLMNALEKIQAADHLVWFFPVWWGGLPAIAKGFIDRLFLPNLVFSYRENSNRVIGHLHSKSARLITTLDQPGWFYRWYYGEPSTRQLKKATLQFCGVSRVTVNYIGTVRGASSDQRQKWLNQIGKYAEKDCQLISS